PEDAAAHAADLLVGRAGDEVGPGERAEDAAPERDLALAHPRQEALLELLGQRAVVAEEGVVVGDRALGGGGHAASFLPARAGALAAHAGPAEERAGLGVDADRRDGRGHAERPHDAQVVAAAP